MNRLDITLIIPYVPPSVNQTNGMHWSKMRAVKRDSAFAVLHAHARAGRPTSNEFATIDFTIHQHGKPRDPDNTVASCKWIIDQMVKCKMLVDDSPDWWKIGTINHTPAPPREGYLEIRVRYGRKEPNENELPVPGVV